MTGAENGRWPVMLGDWPVLRVVEMIPATRRQIRELAGRVAEGAGIAADVELMACELLTNAVQHGSGEKMLVRVSSDGHALRVEVREAGCAPQLPAADRDVLGERGRGLLLVAALSLRWGLEHDGEGTTAWFEAQASDSEPMNNRDVRGTPQPARDGHAAAPDVQFGQQGRWPSRRGGAASQRG